VRGRTARVLGSVARNLAGLAAFFAIWIILFVLGAQAGDFWFWLGLLFGWLPAIAAANFVERAWPLLLVAAAAAVAWRLMG